MCCYEDYVVFYLPQKFFWMLLMDSMITYGYRIPHPLYHARDYPRTRMVTMFPAFSCAALRRSNFVFGVTIRATSAWLLGLCRDTDRCCQRWMAMEIILDGAGTNTRLCRGVLRTAFGVGRGGSHPPPRYTLKAYEPRNGAASQVSASHYGYNGPY